MSGAPVVQVSINHGARDSCIFLPATFQEPINTLFHVNDHISYEISLFWLYSFSRRINCFFIQFSLCSSIFTSFEADFGTKGLVTEATTVSRRIKYFGLEKCLEGTRFCSLCNWMRFWDRLSLFNNPIKLGPLVGALIKIYGFFFFRYFNWISNYLRF
jgi:hypothetical protein